MHKIHSKLIYLRIKNAMSNPKSEESHQEHVDQNPFQGFNIDDNSILGSLEGRHSCPKCGKSRKFFCYSCYVPIKELEGKLPIVKVYKRI